MDIAKLLHPVCLESPAGADVRFDPIFDALQAEVEKLSTPSAAGTVEWQSVVELASAILANESKDLLVTSYLAVALVHTRGGAGLVLGLQLYHGLLETFWEELHPPRSKMRGRLLSVEWWLEKTLAAAQLGSVSPTPSQSSQALELLGQIETLLRERAGDAPSFSRLRGYFEAQQGGESPAPAVAEAVAKEPPKVQGPAPEAVAEGAQPDAARALDAALQKVREAALLLRRQDRCGPLGYRLLRTSLWAALSVLPPSGEGRTRIPAPESRLTAALLELRQKSSAEALLEASEGLLSQFIFWLDLNRLSFEALGLLGDSFRHAKEAILRETLLLLERLPGLEELAFCDGTPFADAETRRWLQGAAPAVPLSLPAVPVAVAGDAAEEAAMCRATEEAQLLLREGKLPQALDFLHGKRLNCRSGREKLLWRLALVQFLLGAGVCRPALPQLEQVLCELDQHALESYDPELALGALRLAYLGFQAQGEPSFKEKALSTLFRIGRLDPAEMVRLEQV